MAAGEAGALVGAAAGPSIHSFGCFSSGSLGLALVGLTQRFYRERADLLALLRQEAARGSRLARRIAAERMRPVFQTVIAGIERLKESGAVAADVDARHLFVSVVSMAAYPILEPLLVEMVWEDTPSDARLDESRCDDVVATALARMRPK